MTDDIKAHQCILSGTTAKEITIYNTCLANSKKDAKIQNNLERQYILIFVGRGGASSPDWHNSFCAYNE